MAPSHLEAARTAEEAGNLELSAAEYALAYDLDEKADGEAALRAALTFFEAQDGGNPRIEQDAYAYFDRWIDRAINLGYEPSATFWKNYEAMIYRGGVWSETHAQYWLNEGCEDAILTLAVNYPNDFRDRAATFSRSLRSQKTYRARYLYSILGHRFDLGDA